MRNSSARFGGFGGLGCVAALAGVCVAGLGAAGCADPNAGFRPPVAPEATKAEAKQGEGDLTFAKVSRAPEGARADQAGLATWYGGAFAGKKTSSGERFDPTKYTAAHRTLKFGTWVEVRRVDTGRTVRVRINDRGPWGDDRRIIDLSRKAAEELDVVREGVARVELRVVDGP
jgi:rare lipoprotein A